MILSESLQTARQTGRRVVKIVTALYALVAVCTAWAVGNDVTLTMMIAAGICLISVGAHRFLGTFSDYALVVALVGQTALITATFAGHPWQLDSHMIYYVSLAVSILLINPRVLVASAGIIAVHHAVFGIAMPALVFPATDLMTALARTGFHAAIVIVETAALVWVVMQRLHMIRMADKDNAQLRKAAEQVKSALAEAEEARTAAVDAQHQAETEAKRAQIALKKASEQAAQTREADAAKRHAEERHATAKKATTDALEQVIGDVSDALAGLAAKNLEWRLSAPFPEIYEGIRTDYNTAISSLAETISNVATQVEKIRGNAGAIATTSKDQSKRSEERSRALLDVTGSVRDLAASVGLVAQNAAKASETVTISRQHADNGVRILDKAFEAMQHIDESANEIRNIVSVIEDIAFQTNLLSLNAGVEAARAGEAGRGFAVVATEVRALAQRSSASAHEIKLLIAKSDDQVKTGFSLVKDSGAALEQILEVVSRTDGEVDGINTSVHDQDRRLAIIATALEQLSKSAQQDTVMIEETAAASVTLDGATDDLSRAISVFELGTAAPDQSSQWHVA